VKAPARNSPFASANAPGVVVAPFVASTTRMPFETVWAGRIDDVELRRACSRAGVDD
jgi:hypothetical protein